MGATNTTDRPTRRVPRPARESLSAKLARIDGELRRSRSELAGLVSHLEAQKSRTTAEEGAMHDLALAVVQLDYAARWLELHCPKSDAIPPPARLPSDLDR